MTMGPIERAVWVGIGGMCFWSFTVHPILGLLVSTGALALATIVAFGR